MVKSKKYRMPLLRNFQPIISVLKYMARRHTNQSTTYKSAANYEKTLYLPLGMGPFRNKAVVCLLVITFACRPDVLLAGAWLGGGLS